MSPRRNYKIKKLSELEVRAQTPDSEHPADDGGD
jgi:hypothetical protein